MSENGENTPPEEDLPPGGPGGPDGIDGGGPDIGDGGAVDIVDELKQSYLDYAMSVIVGRALPDVRDGLKPVHRRILYAQHQLANSYNRPYKKSARVVGDVIGKYHPHGDVAVYDALVRMAQDFSMRYTLVDGQGNFGSMDGDSPAAMRYTEVRLHRRAHLMLDDIDKDTVDLQPNYDDNEMIPAVLPTRLPNLLVNGAEGIAVGMATKIPPHNLREVCSALLALLEDPELDTEALFEHLQGPDFPTGGIINGVSGIYQAYRTGRGSIRVRAKAEVISQDKRDVIIVHEIPFQVNKARMIERIAEMVRDKRIEGITEIRDESDKDGVRVVIELKRGEMGEVVLNNLYAHSQLEVSFGINMVALDANGQPRLFNLREMLDAYLDHRREVVSRRTAHELLQARERGHRLEGLAVALANLDEILDAIRTSLDQDEATEKLVGRTWPLNDVAPMLARAGSDACRPPGENYVGGVEGLAPDQAPGEGHQYRLSTRQARAILDMRLHRLTGMEQEELRKQYGTELDNIIECEAILADPERLKAVIRGEIEDLAATFGDERRTLLQEDELDLTRADLVPPQQRIITLSRTGYIKAQPLRDYRSQRRGGVGRAATAVKDEDVVMQLVSAHTHDDLLLFFTNHGKVFRLSTLDVPVMGNTSRGRPLVNLLRLAEGEQVAAVLPVSDFGRPLFMVMATARGRLVRVALEEFASVMRPGKKALRLLEGDSLVEVRLAAEDEDLMLVTTQGKLLRTAVANVRLTRRGSQGVLGVKMAEGVRVVSLLMARPDHQVLLVTENGFGKRSDTSAFRPKGRRGMGVRALPTGGRNGDVVAARLVQGDEDLIMITNGGTLVRIPVGQIRSMGTAAQGVSVARLRDESQIVDCVVVEAFEEDDDEADEGAEAVALAPASDESPDESPESEQPPEGGAEQAQGDSEE